MNISKLFCLAMAKSCDDYMSTILQYLSINSQLIFNYPTATCQLIHNCFAIILHLHANYLATTLQPSYNLWHI
jgi:hypothetical protein